MSAFPSFLLPSLPFRRRSSTSTTTTTSSTATADYFSTSPTRSDSIFSNSPSETAASAASYLNGSRSLLRCSKCLTHLCQTSDIISKGFTGRHGRAYLIAPPAAATGLTPPCELRHWSKSGNLPNTHSHKPVPRQLVTGAHTVSDVSCVTCGTILGWKYVDAEEDSQKYKVGKFILETKKVLKGVCWENEQEFDDSIVEAGGVVPGSRAAGSGPADVQFDSEDEDECEDLFAGVWSPALARRRRRLKAWRSERE